MDWTIAPASSFFRGTGGGGGGGGGGSGFATLAVSNPGPGSLAANSYVQFGHPYGATDIASGNILAITDDLGTTVPYTAMRRSVGSGTSTRFSDNVARLPNSISAPLTVSSITHSGATGTATTGSSHGLSTGNYVHLEGQAPDDYCGFYAVTVSGASTFTYVMPTTPATNATTAGTMNYCRVLTLSATAGSWNNTLPNGKSSTNIITDITTNFDNLTLTLSSVTNSAGSTVASGTFNADLATALAASGTAGQLRTPTTGQGQLVCDIVALMKFNDNVTPSTHLGTMSAWFYLTAFLDQTTGAVQELRCRAWIDNSLANAAMDFMTYKAKLTLGSTIVRSTGLSSTLAIDGKLQTIAAASVSTVTGYWNMPNHGFVGGETVRLTTTGSLPSGGVGGGFSLNTDYAVIWVDASNIALTTNFSEGNQIGNSSLFIPASAGSGNHTVTCWLHSSLRNRLPYCRNDGLPDRWTGKTGAFSAQLAYPIHDKTYLQATKMVPAVDLSINLTNKIAVRGGTGVTPDLDVFCWGGLGSLQYGQDTGGAGAHHEYGGPWTDVPLRRLRYCNDRAGYAQSLRVDALMMGAFDMSLINDDTTWRMPVVNNGSNHAGAAYTSLPTPAPNSYFGGGGGGQVGFTAPTSATKQNGLGAYSFTHRYIFYPRLYLFEGGLDVHDMIMLDANSTLLANSAGIGTTFPTTAQLSAKIFSISGTNYYTWINGSEERADAWTVQVYTDAVMLGDDGCVEKPYIRDLFTDWLKAANWLLNTYSASVDPNSVTIGGWVFNSVARYGPGNAYAIQCDAGTGLMESYLGETWGHCSRMYGTQTDFDALIATFYKLVDNLYRVTAGNGWIGNTYGFRVKQAAGSSVSPDATQTISAATEPMIEDSNLSHPSSDLATGGFIVYRTDGLILGMTNIAYQDVHPVTGDRHYLTDTDVDGTVSPGAYSGPPSSNKYLTYYVRQSSGSYTSWKYSTTNTDADIITSYASVGSTTLSAAITTTGQTAITTVAVPIFSVTPISVVFGLLVVGSEVINVIGAFRGPFNVVGGGAISTTNGSATVSINLPSHGLSTGDKIRLTDTDSAGTGSVVVGGLTLSGADRTVTVVDANNLTITLGSNASSSTTGGSCYWNANRFTVTRGFGGTTAATALNGATIYSPYISTMYADLQNRVVAFPPTGHGYRVTGGAAIAAPDGYLTMARSSAFYGYLCGKIARTAFENADQWFSDTAPSTPGPTQFAVNNTLKDSVNTSLTS